MTVLLLIGSSVNGEELTLQEFSMLLRHLSFSQQEQTAEEGFYLTNTVNDLCSRLAQVNLISIPQNKLRVDLFWINEVMSKISTEVSASRQRLLFSNLIDTLNALESDIASNDTGRTVTRQEMLAALDRAIEGTTVIRVSQSMQPNASVTYSGNGAYVNEEPGEAIMVVQESSTSAASSHSRLNSGNSGTAVSAPGQASRGSSNVNSSAKTNAAGASLTARQNNSPAQKPQPAKTLPLQSPPKPPAATAQKPPPPPPPPQKNNGGSANFIYYMILFSAFVAFAGLVYYLVRTFKKRVAIEQAAIKTEQRLLPPEKLQLKELYEKAMQAAAAEEYAKAIRLLATGALLQLEEHSIMQFNDHMTNGEYLRQLIDRHRLHSLFADPMALFDRLIYGQQQPAKEDFDVFHRFYQNLERFCK
jgi:hypothetical protein